MGGCFGKTEKEDKYLCDEDDKYVITPYEMITPFEMVVRFVAMF
jgi:hypothetical protein